MDPQGWLRARDPGLAALRRAGRAALVMPAMFALGEEVIGNPAVATFAAFGSFAMLLLVDFGGPMRDRLQAQAGLALAGAAFVCVGTVCSRSAWLGALAMGVVGFGVLFAGSVSSVLAGATVSLLLAFILPVSLAAPISSIPDRLAGWGMASAAALLAVALLWPAPARNPLRDAAIAACRALGLRLRADAFYLLGGKARPSAERDDAIAQANAAVAVLHRVFFATPYRPTGLGTAARTVVRLVDELSWVNTILVQSRPHPAGMPVSRPACAVKVAAASVLESGADLLERRAGPPDALHIALADLGEAVAAIENDTTAGGPLAATDGSAPSVISSLDPNFRAQELGFVVSQIAANIDLTAAAERRSWPQRMLGRQPEGVVGSVSAAHERAASHLERHSVWLHNSIRGAVGLGFAVLVANLTGVQHSFWVVLGTLSVLRSNALATGQNVVRAILGTAAGFVVAAGLLAVIGTNTTLLWFLLPPAILLAGLAPAAVSFAAGQAAFTLVLVILFNILQPAGWRVGLLRIEDVVLGCAVSLAVGVLFWPRGAGAALGQALTAAYTDSARYLTAAVDFGLGRCDHSTTSRPAPTAESVLAAAASRRLDDAFRSYLAERGAKPIPLADVTGLLTGAAGLRLAADAVLDLWESDDGRSGGDRTAARGELRTSSERVAAWYEAFATALAARGDIREPLEHDALAERRLVDAVRRDLRSADGRTNAVAVRIIWTGDHLDAARRLQATIAGPARAVTDRARDPLAGAFPWLRRAEQLQPSRRSN
jgi:uncharacterized membrane protein YccC